MKNFLVVADDFTGANDTGVKLTERGTPVEVVFSALNLDSNSSCVIDTETRNEKSSVAYGKVKDIMGTISINNYDVVYKKVDSTLRGNISDEIAAVVDIYHPDYVVFDPALPSMGRTVVNGNLLVNGKHLKDTEFAHDPIKPIRTENIVDILKEKVNPKLIRFYDLDELHQDNLILDLSKKYFCFDTKSDTDFTQIISLFKDLKGKILWIGSAGLIESLTSNQKEYLPAIGLVGSVSQKNREQLHYAEENGINLISLPIYEIYSLGNYKKYVDRAIRLLNDNKDVVLMSSASYNRADLVKTKESFEKDGIKGDQLEEIIQTILAGICRQVVEKHKVSGIYVTGGATAHGLLNMVKAERTIVKEEIALGMPLLQIKGGEFDGINIISKAGAFGDSSFLVFALKKLSYFEKR